MKKDPTRIERTRGSKIRQISPAKEERLKDYFTRIGGRVSEPVETPRGLIRFVRAPGQTTIELKVG